ncbi:MAG: carboxypeptidase regulatory-like domain-containing protein [Saprospiraceae bacterium]|nr:carboxypeptidase regulatory-like domain-containing protein [Saprospiraceae bacterium]
MQRFKTYLLSALVLSVAFTACLKDNFLTPAQTVEVAFAGRVIDDNGQPIAGAHVRAGGDLSVTDDNGVFRLKELRLEARNAKLFVNKIGYYDFSRAYFVENGSFQNVTIQLMKKEQTASFNAAAGGVIEVPGGPKLIFPANAISTENGQSYSGGVRVYARYLDPTDPNLNLYMPGDLRGIDADGQERALMTYGMIGVELEGNGGQVLNIASGSSVELHMPVASAQAAGAPDRIPLWHYDLQQARWIEEGFVEKSGNEFIGKVSHFSFWNVDVSFSLVELSGKVYLGDSTNAFSGAKIRLTMTSDSTSAYATTDAMGCYKGGVPAGETFLMEILDACGEVIFSQTIGPFNEDTMLPPIVLTSAGSNQLSVSGTLLDCDGMPVSNGYVKVSVENLILTAFTDNTGAFSLQAVRCDTAAVEGKAIAFDLDKLLQSDEQTFNVPPDSIALGDITVCDTLNEFIIYTLDNQDFVKVDPSCGVIDSFGIHTFITAFNGQDVITLSFNNNNQTGTFPLSNFWAGQINVAQPPSGIFTTVTTAPANVGDVIEGEFSGTFLDFFGAPHTVQGTYRVVRDW